MNFSSRRPYADAFAAVPRFLQALDHECQKAVQLARHSSWERHTKRLLRTSDSRYFLSCAMRSFVRSGFELIFVTANQPLLDGQGRQNWSKRI